MGYVTSTPTRRSSCGSEGDGLNREPFGSEFTIILFDDENEPRQSTRWIGRMMGDDDRDWAHLKYYLKAAPEIIGNPWEHPRDFITSMWAPPDAKKDGALDLDRIRGIAIKVSTTLPAGSTSSGPHTIWVDQLQVVCE